MLSFGSNCSPILWCMYQQYPTNSTISVFVFGCLHCVCRPYHRLLAKIETDPEAKRPPPLGYKTWRICYISSWFVDSTWRGWLVIFGRMYKQWKFDQVEEFTTLHLTHLNGLEQWSRNDRMVLFLSPLFKDIRNAHIFRSLRSPVYSRL